MGFAVPLEKWLRNDLRDWAEALLHPVNISSQGYLDSRAVQTMWAGFLNGNRKDLYILWDILMFQAWLGEHSATPGPA